MKKYELVLKNEKEKFYKIINWLLLAVNFISIILLTLSIRFHKLGPIILATAAVLAFFFIHYFQRKNEKLIYSTAFFIFCLAWDVAGYWWIGVANLLFMFLSILSLRKLIVLITEETVTYPSLFNKKIKWDELSNVILKDGLLTIDFKNNKLVQQLVDESNYSTDEKEFNDFCCQQLDK